MGHIQTLTASVKSHLIIGVLLGIISDLKSQSFCTEPKIQIHTTVTASNVSKIQPHAIVASPDGGFWATGTISTSTDKLDFMVAKFNDSGRLVLLKRLGTPGDETSYPIGLAPTSSGGCVISGRSDEPSIGAGLAAVAYINPNGTLKWWRRTTSNGNYGRYDAFRNILVRKDGKVFGTGSSHQWNYNSQLILAALDSNGNELFRNSYRYESQTHMDASAEFGTGYVVAGHDGSSPVVLTVTDAGVVDQCFGYSSDDYCPITSIILSPSGKFYVTGGYMINGKYELWVACINPSDGKFIWQKRYALNYTFGGKIDWVDKKLLVTFQSKNGSTWSNGFAEIDSNGNPLSVKLVKFNNFSFENHLAGINGSISPKGGWAFIGTNNSLAANMSLSLINPCDTAFCSIINTNFTSVNNTNIQLSNRKGKMYYDGKFATNLTPSIQNVTFNQKDDCLACIKPVPTKFRDTTICKKDSIILKVSDYTAQVKWFDGDTNHIKEITKAGIYTIELQNNCAVYKDTFQVKNYPEMILSLPDSAEFCPGKSIGINASQTGSVTYTYLWEDGSTRSSRTINQPGIYTLKTSDVCAIREDTVVVSIKKTITPTRLKDTIICSLPAQFIQKIEENSFTVKWFDGDNSRIKSFNDVGVFSVEIFNGCSTFFDTFEIFKLEPPEKILPDSVVLCRGNLLSISGQQTQKGNFNYEWSNSNKTAQIEISFQPIIWLKTSNICSSRIDTVEILSALCDCEICVPNAFTPVNIDGINDGFKPRLDCKYLDCKVKKSYMKIFNRWGEKIHDAPVTIAWDGTYMGKKVPQGNYIYEIFIIFDDYVSGDRIITESGVVTVLSGND